jgi:energy-coupling factor transporter ATP-binding protein EcfA2
VRDVSLAVGSGAFVSVVGPTGCGKSTLLNVGAGLLELAPGASLNPISRFCGDATTSMPARCPRRMPGARAPSARCRRTLLADVGALAA